MNDMLHDSDDIAERRIQRMEQRYRRAEVILVGARARLHMLREVPGVTELQLALALKMLQLAQRRLDDIAQELEALEAGISLN